MDGGFVHGEIGEQGVLTVMLSQTTRLYSLWVDGGVVQGEIGEQGVLTIMFELSSRCLNASGVWWIRARRPLWCRQFFTAFYGFLRLLTVFYGLFTDFYGFLRLFAAFDGFFRLLTDFSGF